MIQGKSLNDTIYYERSVLSDLNRLIAHLVERHSRWRQFDRERVSESVQVLFLNFIEENIRRLTGFAAAHAKQKPKSNGQFRQEQLKLLSQDLLKRPKSRTVDFRHHF